MLFLIQSSNWILSLVSVILLPKTVILDDYVGLKSNLYDILSSALKRFFFLALATPECDG